jgi:membrane-bound serine protease (ClpP class)
MDVLLDANVAYLLLASGAMLAILALVSPGTGILEIGALLLLGLAGWMMLNLPINLLALLLLLLGVFPFLLAVRRSGRLIYLVVAIVTWVIGSAFLFRGLEWWQPAVNPFLALMVSAFSAGYMWLAMRKVLEADQIRPSHDRTALLGAIGQARTDILGEGSVQVDGELWSARSEKLIPGGTRVRVVGWEGLTLMVEAANHGN